MAAIGKPESATSRSGPFGIRCREPRGDARRIRRARARRQQRARRAAARAVLDTVGVTLAGASQPAARIVQSVIERQERLRSTRAAPAACSERALPRERRQRRARQRHGRARARLRRHVLRVARAPERTAGRGRAGGRGNGRASGRALLDAYVVGFEIEGRLGRAMNPRHYQRGWHCTSTLGTIGAAAASPGCSDSIDRATAHALAIAASEASGLKENFGTMVKPLHGGLAARNGVLAAQLAQAGMTASAAAIEGPQGFLAAMDSESPSLDAFVADLGDRWEILDTGITVKLYPSCAAHPSRRSTRCSIFGGASVSRPTRWSRSKSAWIRSCRPASDLRPPGRRTRRRSSACRSVPQPRGRRPRRARDVRGGPPSRSGGSPRCRRA